MFKNLNIKLSLWFNPVRVCHLQAQKLQKKDLQLKAMDAFYKEQLEQLEKRVRHSSKHAHIHG